MKRFVNPITARYPLSDNDWIEIKDRLTVGEQKRVETSGLKRVLTEQGAVGSIVTDFAEFSFARTVAYLTDWSLKGEDGKSVPLSRSAIEALDPDTYREIEDAITAHIEARGKEKNAQSGELASTAS